MSSSKPIGSLSDLLGAQLQQKSVSLVKRITEKTKAGRIAWKKSSTGFIASVRGGLELGFVPATGLIGMVTGNLGAWSIFTVRGQGGDEILKIENPKNTIPTYIGAALSGPSEPLVAAVDQLYSEVRGADSTNIDKAISLVDEA
ncbi:MAG: hypothetical protein ACYDCM_06970 [Candidatus Acidiferrales bacterium]